MYEACNRRYVLEHNARALYDSGVAHAIKSALVEVTGDPELAIDFPLCPVCKHYPLLPIGEIVPQTCYHCFKGGEHCCPVCIYEKKLKAHANN